KSSPHGNTQPPFLPGELAIGSQARFFARVGGNTPKEMTEVFIEAAGFKGTSLIEVLQNCVIFNDGAFAKYTDKAVRADKQLFVKHGEPMIFGKERDKGLVLNGLKLEVVTLGENGITEADLLVHNAELEDPTLHQMLVRSEYPMVTGIIRSVPDITFEEREAQLTDNVKAKSNFTKTDDLFFSGETYEVD
ncbi:MAG: 2-oxoacid:ferredoxin oxidoreductase subunit beta, partial [Eudoraea sp.]|nr:2-oxoacid:ferredoxin oxidoreductase subunit beta [Eudoraea sp.]NNJ40102.1 2-oxoacid:ferredoxin oxidoreductase subunit beta [Eudoraea sp.]